MYSALKEYDDVLLEIGNDASKNYIWTQYIVRKKFANFGIDNMREHDSKYNYQEVDSSMALYENKIGIIRWMVNN